MTDKNDQINQLLERLNALSKKQTDFLNEINDLRLQINRLRLSSVNPIDALKDTADQKQAVTTEPSAPAEKIIGEHHQVSRQYRPEERTRQPVRPLHRGVPAKTNFEKFIGENLTAKIGIAITVIGVAIGAKYAIDNQLISPLTRIILGYLAGVGLLGFAIQLKKKYENFSAVLLSGSMAILYFITYAAYSFYSLIPQAVAFGLMVVFTIFTVVAAITYNRQIIAKFGLVGAYAVPFLLSDGSGKVSVLFTYMAIINAGIVFIAFKRYWKPLYYSSFVLTWMIYAVWYVLNYEPAYFGLALTFLTVFFLTFYLTFLAYKLLQKEKFAIGDIFLLLTNSFVFFGFGYHVLSDHETGGHLLGLFALGNAVIHFVVGVMIHRRELADRNLVYFISGLVLVFVTIAIPVQLDGNWVTLLWAGEAALLFWIGRTKNVEVYERLSFPLMILAFVSLVQDWTVGYNNYIPSNPETRVAPLLNICFLTSILFITAFAWINRVNAKTKYEHAPERKGFQKWVHTMMSFLIPAILLSTVYYAFRLEIANYWDQLEADSALTISDASGSVRYFRDEDLGRFKSIWIINYSLLFAALLAIVNLRKIRSQRLVLLSLGLIFVTVAVFLTEGLYVLGELRESYLENTLAQYYKRSAFSLGIRYISFAFAAFAILSGSKVIKRDFVKKYSGIVFELLLHTAVLWVVSSELVHWMDISGSTQTYKLGLSILWGVYALFLIALGIRSRKKHLRIGAIVLFGITLIKLFFYDIPHLNTISKTIVLVSLGVLLLIISFLYNKYKHVISDEIKA
jgi:uncharacterized membrane protein